jgi:hypothetical protein
MPGQSFEEFMSCAWTAVGIDGPHAPVRMLLPVRKAFPDGLMVCAPIAPILVAHCSVGDDWC